MTNHTQVVADIMEQHGFQASIHRNMVLVSLKRKIDKNEVIAVIDREELPIPEYLVQQSNRGFVAITIED